jgi:phosphoserine phosphatase RsbU/P
MAGGTDFPVTVLLVDDQAIVGETLRRMLATENDIRFFHCLDPLQALEQANTLEPTVILQDLVMPDIDGLTLVKFFRANAKTRDVPLIVLSTKEEPIIKAQAFSVGANDYLVKLPDKLELIARIRYHSKGYVAQLERNEAYRKLAESQTALADEVAEAANYVLSLLPAPIRAAPGSSPGAGNRRAGVTVDWRFIPSTSLGGDSFGYHWLDDDHFAMYLLDVSGHGVGASLLSVSARNVIGGQTLPRTDFRDPGQVLARLNDVFPMEKHNNKFFTVWYGVYRQSTRSLAYGAAGHPPALLLDGPDRRTARLKTLEANAPVIGVMPDFEYSTNTVNLDAFARMFIYSDGVFEIGLADGTVWPFDDFVHFIAAAPPEGETIERLLAHVRQLGGSETLADDFSMLQIEF